MMPSPQADGDMGLTVAQRVAQAFVTALDLDPSEVQPGCLLVDDYGVIPHERERLTEALEDEFSLYIRASDADRWTDVASVIGYVEGRQR